MLSLWISPTLAPEVVQLFAAGPPPAQKEIQRLGISQTVKPLWEPEFQATSTLSGDPEEQASNLGQQPGGGRNPWSITCFVEPSCL